MASRIGSLHSLGLLKSMQKLSTGYRINRAADDPAGLITSNHLRSMLAAIKAESKSLQRTSHVANSAEGALSEVSSMINEAQALLVANANTGGLSDEERQANQTQLDSILASIDRIAGSTTFNRQRLLDGSLTLTANGQNLTIDSMTSHSLGAIEIDGQSYSLADLGSGKALNITSGNLDAAQQVLHAARDKVASMRGSIGAFQRHTVATRLNSLNDSHLFASAANSLIRDTDYAQETSTFARLALLQRSSFQVMAMLNASPSSVLKLLA